MYCKRCGMDSSDTEVCEWCKQPMLKSGPPAAAPTDEEEGPAAETMDEEEPMGPALDDEDEDMLPYAEDEDDAATLPRAGAAAAAAPAAPPMPAAMRFAISGAVGFGVGLISIMVMFLATKQAPTKLYAGMIRLQDGGFGMALLCGVLFGVALALLLGGLLVLAKQGPAVGIPVGGIIGYIFFTPPYAYVGIVAGIIAGIVAGIFASKGKKKVINI